MASDTETATILLGLLNACEEHLERVPAGPQRQLRFGLSEGKGYVKGDEPRVRMCAALYNNRDVLTRALLLLEQEHAVKEAQIQLADRYFDLLSDWEKRDPRLKRGDEVEELGWELSVQYLRWMAQTIIGSGMDWPPDKLGRWVGYVQSGCVLHGIVTVDSEREFSRPLFHAAYKAQGRVLPASIDGPQPGPKAEDLL